jgi:hypothetical protein
MVSGEYSFHFSDYQQADVEHVYQRGDWESWDDVIYWLRTKGMEDGHLTPRKVAHMDADFMTLALEGSPFMKDAALAFQAAQAACSHQGGQHWQERAA